MSISNSYDIIHKWDNNIMVLLVILYTDTGIISIIAVVNPCHQILHYIILYECITENIIVMTHMIQLMCYH